MKYFFLLLLFFANACKSSSNSYSEASSPLDAGREFIDATLKGDFAKAFFYMQNDGVNKKYLDQLETDYRTKDRDGREQFRQASINIGKITELTENKTIINYSNSYDKVLHQLMVVNQNNRWVVDFKYTFTPNL